MTWRIVTDSSCDLPPGQHLPGSVQFAKVPFTICVGDRDYVDDGTLDLPALLHHMETSPEASRTACPSPGMWCEQFAQADRTIAVTISSQLSGSYHSAMAAREMVLERDPDKEIFVLDSRSAGPALALCAERAAALISQGASFDTIVETLQAFVQQRHTVFALASFQNLIKNGRVGRLTGFLAGKLGFWGLGAASPEGAIVVKGAVRGLRHTLEALLDDMRAHRFQGGDVAISHCQNLQAAQELGARISSAWSAAQVRILSTGGLCSYYAERRGLILAY